MAEAVARALHIPYARSEGITLTSNQLKLIAIVAMVFDHCMIVFVPHGLAIYQFLRIPGKLTAPIMCFFIAEGYYHTANLGKYIGRLFLMAVVSHFPFNLLFGYDLWAFWRATDVMWSLLFGLLALSAYHCNWLKRVAKNCFYRFVLPACLFGRLELYCCTHGFVLWHIPSSEKYAGCCADRHWRAVSFAGSVVWHFFNQ